MFSLCGLNDPLTRDCRNTTKCSECQSVKHVAAMHAGKPPEPTKPEAKDPNGDYDQSQHPPNHGGENEATTKSVDDPVLKYVWPTFLLRLIQRKRSKLTSSSTIKAIAPLPDQNCLTC